MCVNSFAQVMPLVYSVENTGANCPSPSLPSLGELPLIQALPDPFAFADGRGRMANYSDWEVRRAQIGAQIQNYEIGQRPVRPDTITASYSGGLLTVIVTVNGKTLTLSSQVILPSGNGPFPVVIGMNSQSGSIPQDIFSSRNIAQIIFVQDQVTSYETPSNTDPFFQLYPNLNVTNTGQYSAWSWGVSRIIDGLELVQNVLPIDLKHICVTGCSYAGKMALFAGAFDERVALTIAQESGGGGATSWRYSHSLPAGTVEDIDNTNYSWFMKSMSQFSGNKVSYLPEDHHELMAMCAPRALYITANPEYVWLSSQSSYVCSEACKTVYTALGIPDRFGYSIVGNHLHCEVPDSQTAEIGAFVDKFMLGKDTVNTANIADPYFSIPLSPWITWTNPTLLNDTTYFTSLVYPPNDQPGLDTSITLKWNKVSEAQKYLIQLSTDAAFTSVFKSDSTTTDTLITFTGLQKNQEYYWRVQVRSSAGPGPWSNISSFVTTLLLPDKPRLVSAVSNQIGNVTFTWNTVSTATRYLGQVAYDQAFTNVFRLFATSDSVDIISWFTEGQLYYWRVQAINLSGSGAFSAIANFTLLYAPTSLALQLNASDQITLTWTNNSTIADGNLIERMQSPQTSFSLLDTLKGSGNSYVDKQVETGQIYTYRVRAYKDSLESNYSNQVSSNVTGVKEGSIPKEYSISQNYPNPFNPSTVINYALPKSSLITIKIYNILGQEVKTLINSQLQAGYYTTQWNGDNNSGKTVSSGMYICRVDAGQYIKTIKMMLLK